MDIHHFSNQDAWIQVALKIVDDSCTGKNCKIALSGGSTPRPFYEALSKTKHRENSEFFQVDERYIAKTDEKSNHKLIRDSLNPKTFHYFDTSLSINAALQTYAKKLPKEFDLVILGIGPDGHIASLFPNSSALETKEPVAHTQTQTFDVKDRLTLTFPLILGAKKILILLKGQNKVETLEELLYGKKSPQEFPAKELISRRVSILFLK